MNPAVIQPNIIKEDLYENDYSHDIIHNAVCTGNQCKFQKH